MISVGSGVGRGRSDYLPGIIVDSQLETPRPGGGLDGKELQQLQFIGDLVMAIADAVLALVA
jgi:hypothetical protein